MVHDAVKLVRAQYEWISAGQQDIVHLGVLPYVISHLRVIRRNLIRVIAYNPFAEAVAAIRRAPVRDQEKAGLRIFMLQPGNNGVAVFAAGIKRAWTLEFLRGWLNDVFELFIVAA